MNTFFSTLCVSVSTLALLLFTAEASAQQVQLLSGLPQLGQTSGGIVPLLNVLFTMLLAGAAVLAVLFIAIGGFEIMSHDSPFNISQGKDRIRHAVVGLLIILGSYLILYTINPDLVRLAIFQNITPVDTSALIRIDGQVSSGGLTPQQQAVHGLRICNAPRCLQGGLQAGEVLPEQCSAVAGCAVQTGTVCRCAAGTQQQENPPGTPAPGSSPGATPGTPGAAPGGTQTTGGPNSPAGTPSNPAGGPVPPPPAAPPAMDSNEGEDDVFGGGVGA